MHMYMYVSDFNQTMYMYMEYNKVTYFIVLTWCFKEKASTFPFFTELSSVGLMVDETAALIHPSTWEWRKLFHGNLKNKSCGWRRVLYIIIMYLIYKYICTCTVLSNGNFTCPHMEHESDMQGACEGNKRRVSASSTTRGYTSTQWSVWYILTIIICIYTYVQYA